MCTAPQEYFYPENWYQGRRCASSFEDVEKALVEAFEGIINHPKMGPAVLAALQSETTQKRVQEAKSLGGKVLLETKPVANPEFPSVPSASPMIMDSPRPKKAILHVSFWTNCFIIATADTDESIELASSIAHEHGAISCGAYTLDDATMEKIAEKMQTPARQFRSFDWWHLCKSACRIFRLSCHGRNPAGNACFTDPEFVLKRFTRSAQSQFELMTP